jgi:hypothetical protein
LIETAPFTFKLHGNPEHPVVDAVSVLLTVAAAKVNPEIVAFTFNVTTFPLEIVTVSAA